MKMKKVLLALSMILGLTSCGINGTKPSQNPSDVGSSNTSECTDDVCGGDVELNLDVINDYLENDPYWSDLNVNGNKVTLIPFKHINGPKVEWDFFALVNFEYDMTSYYKYQVTYLSCTCRSNDVNYWQTAYVELSCPKSGNVDDVKLRKLSFDQDGTGDYLAGFWGDSGVGHAIPGSLNNVTYEDIKTAFIPYLVGKTYKDISSYDGYKVGDNVYDDTVFGIDKDDFAQTMAKKEILYHGEKPVTLDDFNGASVSTNNILRMLIPLMEYHAANNI